MIHLLFKTYKAFVFLLLSFLCFPLYAELIPIKDLDRRYDYYHSTYTANDDYTYEQQHKWAVKVLDKRAIKDLKKVRISYSTSVEKIEVLEAYNMKADGTRVDTPKDNYQLSTNKGRGKDAPVFSDRSSITTIFPEVEVGDTLVFSYKRSVSESMFPGYFTAQNSFSLNTAYDEVKMEVIVPDFFEGLYQARNMEETISKQNGKIHYLWAWSNKNPVRDTRQDYSVWDLETNPGFAYSTFNSYEAIARAYGKRALSKVIISDRVKQLANKIVGVEKDSKEQARLLYEWVATKITYAGNCVGVGAVVPHDISFILDNHMGDCKDHATLLQALLTALNIKSEQALINSGSIFTLPTIPAVNSVNHVINYLPDYDLFIDSTSENTPFGLLPGSIEGKPVLMVENFVEGMKTPAVKAGTHKQNYVADMIIGEDGSIKGKVMVELHGNPAVNFRADWRTVSKDREDDWLENMFTNNGNTGSATMDKEDPQPLLDTYTYNMSFDMKEFLLVDSAGAFSINSITPTYFSIGDIVYVPEQIEEHPITCSSGVSVEKFIYKLPKNFKLLDKPRDKKIEGPYLTYEVFYTFEDNILTVNRLFDDQTPGPICSPELIQSQKETLQKISRSLRSQVVYKPVYESDSGLTLIWNRWLAWLSDIK